MQRINHGRIKLRDFEHHLATKYDGQVTKYRTGQVTGTPLWVYHRTDIDSLETHVGTWQTGSAFEFVHGDSDLVGEVVELDGDRQLPDGETCWEIYKVSGSKSTGLWLHGNYKDDSRSSALHVSWREEESAYYTDDKVRLIVGGAA